MSSDKMNSENVYLILGIFLAVITVFGVTGNILSFLVWTKGRRCKNCSGAVYLRFLAVSDTLVLCIPSLELMCYLLKPVGLLRDLNPVFCKIFPICPYFFVQMSTWIVVCLTLEQTVAVCRPFMSTELHSKWRHYVIVLIVTVVSFADNIPLIIAFDWGFEKTSASQDINVSRHNNSGTSLYPNGIRRVTIEVNESDKASENESYDSVIYYCSGSFLSPVHVFVVQLGLIAVIPILVLPACNIVIMTKMNRRNRTLTKLGSQMHGQIRNTVIITMLKRTVAIGFVQCFTSIPIVTMDIFFLFSPEDDITSQVYVVCNTIYYMNNAVNVVFYCLLGRSFRRDCIQFFTKQSTTYGSGSGTTAVQSVASSAM